MNSLTVEIDENVPIKLYSVTEQYCHNRSKGLIPDQAYRLAKGLEPDTLISDRTLRYQEKCYRELACDPRRLPELRLQAAKVYTNMLKGKARKTEKVLNNGEVINIKERPAMTIQADLAKDIMEHNNPTIKKTQNLNINADINPVDLNKYE